MKKQFVFFFWFVDFKCISLGVSLNLSPLHVEIHVPFGFFKIGLEEKGYKPCNWDDLSWRQFGYGGKFLEIPYPKGFVHPKN